MSSSSYSCIGDLDEVMQGILNLDRLTMVWNANPHLSDKEVTYKTFVTYTGELILKVMICNKQ